MIYSNTMYAFETANKDFSLVFFFLPFRTLSGVGTTRLSSCCDKDSAIIFMTGHLPDVNPSWEFR
jgi:hypothetical protein